MKKLTLNNILFIGFGIISVLTVIFGIREIVFINGFITSDNKTQTIIYLQKTTEKLKNVFDNEQMLIKSVIGTENKEELSGLMKQHNLNSSAFLKYKAQLKNSVSEINTNLGNEKLLKITEELSNIYKKETDPLIASLIKTRLKISEIENYSDEETKKKTLAGLLNNLEETENQISESSGIIYENISILQDVLEKQYQKTREEKYDFFKAAQLNVILFLITLIAFSALIYAGLTKYVFNPLVVIQDYLDRLKTGDLPEDLHLNSGKDVSRITSSLNKLTSLLRNAVNFSKELAKGNYKTHFETAGVNDALGNSLLTLRGNIQKTQQEEKIRKQEEQQRQKTNEGLTMFADILRKHSDNIQDLADTVISSLVNFMNANQGALFFLNDENPEDIYYELIGAYAYNRKKYITKHIKPGEGLVGAVALEKYTVYMTEVPEDYIEIESGTGKANPRSVLIVPLKIENNVLGIIELASFKEFKNEEIQMVEKIAESIAASLSSAKINMQTSKLNEQFREREEFLRQTEKELEQKINEIRDLTRKISRLERENQKMRKLIES